MLYLACRVLDTADVNVPRQRLVELECTGFELCDEEEEVLCHQVRGKRLSFSPRTCCIAHNFCKSVGLRQRSLPPPLSPFAALLPRVLWRRWCCGC